MILRDILKILNGNVLCGKNRLEEEVFVAFASDLMSDVLTLHTGNILLITGLSNIQTIRTAEIADINHIILVRNKKANPEFVELASENDQLIIETPYSMFRTCGLLYLGGLNAIY